jgi:hypothetical protein
MGKIAEAVALARRMAADNTHGYDQAHRWGPDYDCSSLVITIWRDVGVPVAGATYTGNMKAAFLKSGFSDVTAQINLSSGYGLRAGDVLLNERSHAAMMVSERQLVQASINERGTVTGGQTGDQTGREINERNYYNYTPGGWDCVLRYKEDLKLADPHSEAEIRPISVSIPSLPTLKKGSKGDTVKAAQMLLRGWGCDVGIWGVDGDFGNATEAAVLAFQRRHGLTADGIIGAQTWGCLLGVR